MVQEVQTTLDYKSDLNLIEGVGYQQRRISDKMQVRDKFSSQATAVAHTISMNYPTVGGEAVAPGWDIASNGGVIYQSKDGNIIIPLAGAYMLQYVPYTGYSQTSYYYSLKIKVDGITQYSERIALGDRETRTISLNLGKGNQITVSMTPEFTNIANVSPTIRLIKL